MTRNSIETQINLYYFWSFIIHSCFYEISIDLTLSSYFDLFLLQSWPDHLYECIFSHDSSSNTSWADLGKKQKYSWRNLFFWLKNSLFHWISSIHIFFWLFPLFLWKIFSFSLFIHSLFIYPSLSWFFFFYY